MKVLDLFCGCGGFTGGLLDAGLSVVAGIDHWDRAIQSYQLNFNHLAVKADLTELSPENFAQRYPQTCQYDFDLIVGGPPCQGFSMAGRRNVSDPRNSLFMEFYKYLEYFQPKGFLMENVAGLLNMKNEQGVPVINIITNYLSRDYQIKIAKFTASDFEVPQNRVRVIIFGIRKDLDVELTLPVPVIPNQSDRIPVKTILQNRDEIPLKSYLSEKAIKGILAKRERMKAKGCGFGAQYLKLDKPSYTIPARYWKDGYDALVKYSETEIRRLTILEIKRIQSFPDNFHLCGNKKEQIMQLGNAVARKFAYHLGLHMKKLLDLS